MESKSIIDVKTAVSAAYNYLISIQDMMGNELQDIRLEEVELFEEKNFWSITLGFDNPVKTKNLLDIQLGLPQREYKVFKVNAHTGEVEAMKIRKL